MLYFYVESPKNAKAGILPSEYDESRLYRSLKQAKADGRGKVFVLDSRKIPATLSGDVQKIPKKALLNIGPYLKPKEIRAGGGILTHKGNSGIEILLIYRRGLWDIPKGKQDPGESIKKCAKREVKEELGISSVKVLDFLDTTTHGYRDGDIFAVKTTHWYHMKTDETRFVPQREEKINQVRWFPLSEAKRRLGHKTLIRLLGRVEHKLF